MFSFQVISEPNFDFSKETLDLILEVIEKIVETPQNWILNIVFPWDDYIKKLNSAYRWKDKETDVLSFHYFDDFQNLEDLDIAWEILLSEKKIVEQWEEYWLWVEKEFYKLVIHSVLHILWFDHEEDDDYIIMKDYENKIWVEIFGKN